MNTIVQFAWNNIWYRISDVIKRRIVDRIISFLIAFLFMGLGFVIYLFLSGHLIDIITYCFRLYLTLIISTCILLCIVLNQEIKDSLGKIIEDITCWFNDDYVLINTFENNQQGQEEEWEEVLQEQLEKEEDWVEIDNVTDY